MPFRSTMVAVIAGEDEDAIEANAAPAPAPAAAAPAPTPQPARAEPVEAPSSPPTETKKDSPSTSSGQTAKGNRVKASPLAKRLAAEQGIDLKTLTGHGPGGRNVKDDREGGPAGGAAPAPHPRAAP